jgi:membrane associated rhomboid family serine protease
MSPYRRYGYYSTSGFGSPSGETVKKLIVINVIVFLAVNLMRGIPWLSFFGLVPRYVIGRLMLWQLVSYMFLHTGLMHLAFNMLMLWFFGPGLEDVWGKREFLYFYFFTGIGAGLCSVVTSSGSYIPIIGASGAIFGILAAYAVMYPEGTILLFFVFPMKMKHAMLVLAGMNLMGAMSSSGGDIAYIAHLGGGLFGYLYLKNEWFRRHLSYSSFAERKNRTESDREEKRRREEEELAREVDRILDKVSRLGMSSLSRRERKILERKSKR